MLESFRLDTGGIGEILRSEFADEIHELAASIASEAQSTHPDADVVVDDYTTDRSVSAVTVLDPRARMWQARDGLLTRAAGATGLQVHSKS